MKVRKTYRRRRAGPPVLEFRDEHAFLSNFYPASLSLPLTGATSDAVEFPTVEHAFQAMKSQDPDERNKIRLASSPGLAKKMGRRVKLRPDWEDVKIQVMEHLVSLKFGNHESLRQALVLTGDRELVEGNWWNDTFWGVCKGQGRNELGIILMQVRDHYSGRRW